MNATVKRLMKFGRYALSLGILAGMVCSCSRSGTQDSKEGTGSPYPAPDFTLSDLAGRSVRLSDFKGKIVFVDFWATWCPPCRKEIPHLKDLAQHYKEQGVVVLGVSVDEGGRAVVEPFVKENEITYPILIGGDSPLDGYSVESIPTLYVINREGLVVARHVGYQPYEQLEETAKSLLNSAPAR